MNYWPQSPSRASLDALAKTLNNLTDIERLTGAINDNAEYLLAAVVFEFVDRADDVANDCADHGVMDACSD